tara:strand:- start:2687 stop:3751 length:1065 start_codon:yes stop_codon:yes gene_type:complete
MARAALIKIRKGTGAPADGTLDEAELAIDTAAKKLYSANATSNTFALSGDLYNMVQTGNSSYGIVTLTVDNLTLSNDAVYITGGADTIVAGNTTVINVNSNATLSSITARGSTTTTTVGFGNTTVTGFINVSSTASIAGNFHVGNSTVNCAISSTGNINTDGTLTVAGLSSLSTLDVSSTSQFDGAVTVGNSTVNAVISAAGNINTDGTLDVLGITTLTGRVDINATTTSSSTTTGALVVDGGVGIAENLYVGGNLIVEGTTTQIESTTVTIDDGLIKLAANQLGTGLDAVDTGIYMTFDVADTQNYSGVFRDQNHTNKAWVFIEGITAEPGGTVTYAASDLAYIEAIIDGGTY